MTYALAYAILMLLWIVTGYADRPAGTSWKQSRGDLILFFLLLLLGWQVFGPLLHR